MNPYANALLASATLALFVLLGSSRLRTCIRAVAAQGLLLGAMPFFEGELGLRTILLALASMSIKGILFPVLMTRILRKADVRREVEPFVGYNASLLMGIALLCLSFWLGSRLPLPTPGGSPLLVPLAFFPTLTGLLVIVSRRKAISQILGYLVMENGIYLFGVALALETPFLVELGVLLDVFVAIFVMGLLLFHIHRTFDHLDADQLSRLRG